MSALAIVTAIAARDRVAAQFKDPPDAPAAPRHAQDPTQPDPRRWKALALLCTAFFMVILDSAIVIVALPSIDADLAFSDGGLQWVLSA